MRVARRFRILSAAAALSRYLGWSLVVAGALGLLVAVGWGPWAIVSAVAVIWVGLMLALVAAPMLRERLGRFDPVWLQRPPSGDGERGARLTYVASVGLYRGAAAALAVAIVAMALSRSGVVPLSEVLTGSMVLLAVLLATLGWVVRGIHMALRAPLVDASEVSREAATGGSTPQEPPPTVVPETEMWIRVRGGSVGYTLVTPVGGQPPVAGERGASRPPGDGRRAAGPAGREPRAGGGGRRATEGREERFGGDFNGR